MSVLKTVARALLKEDLANLSHLQAEVGGLQQTATHYRESYTHLQAQMQAGWSPLGGMSGGFLGGLGFGNSLGNAALTGSGALLEPLRAQSRYAAFLARQLYIGSPLIKRGVETQVNYVFGQGVNFDANDADIKTVLQEFLEDEDNRAELTEHTQMQAKERELQLSGNMFLAFFVDRVTGAVKIGSIPEAQIEQVLTDPDNAKKARYYKRIWTERSTDYSSGVETTTSETRYYPDWRYNPKPSQRQVMIGGSRVDWETRVYHVKAGAFSDWRFGFSEVWAAIEWVGKYERFLDHRAKVAENLSHFSTTVKTSSGAEGVAATTKAIQTSYAKPGLASTNLSDPSNAGKTAVLGEGRELEAVTVKGATIHPDEGRRFLLQVCAAFGLAETFFGDVSVGTLATAESLDRPTELGMSNRQMFWLAVFTNILNFVFYCAIAAPAGPLRYKGTIQTDRNGQGKLVWNDAVDQQVHIEFPPIIVEDASTRITDILAAAAKLPDGMLIARLLLIALGQDDVDKLLEGMFNEDGTPKHPDPTPVAPLATPGQPAPLQPGQTQPPPPEG